MQTKMPGKYVSMEDDRREPGGGRGGRGGEQIFPWEGRGMGEQIFPWEGRGRGEQIFSGEGVSKYFLGR